MATPEGSHFLHDNESLLHLLEQACASDEVVLGTGLLGEEAGYFVTNVEAQTCYRRSLPRQIGEKQKSQPWRPGQDQKENRIGEPEPVAAAGGEKKA